MRRPCVDDSLQALNVVEIHVRRRHRKIEIVLVAKHFQLAGLREDDEFVTEVAADRPELGAHGDRFESHAIEGAQVSNEHLVIGMLRTGLIDIE